MDKLIVKYLQNRLTLQEQYQLSKWLEEDEQNREILRKVEIYWRDHAVDLKEKERRVRLKIDKKVKEEKVEYKRSISYSIRSFLRIAALFLLGLSTVFLAYNLGFKQSQEVESRINYVEKRSERGEKITVKLPDGSTVKLNSGSSITYPEMFLDDRREVVLKGEGFFDVKKNQKQPFIVMANKAKVKVLGTSFNVNTVKSSNQVVVWVKTGLVKISNASETISRILNPNELLVFDNNDEVMDLKMIRDPELIFGWTDQLLAFNDETINEVLNTLSNWFGIEFILEKNIDNERVFTSKFENPTLKSVLESLSYVYDFKYEINEKTVKIK